MATPLAPLAMSQTKDDLLKHLNMDAEIYTLMAKEADQIYRWLTSDRAHLKKNCKRKPPYDWSDIVEKSKDEAMQAIARNGSEHTNYYWNLAEPTTDCPNWIARWFLYHKFRYRDGRNRNVGRAEEITAASNTSHLHHHHHHHHNHNRHHHSHHRQPAVGEETDSYGNRIPYYTTPSARPGDVVQGYDSRETDLDAAMSSSQNYAIYPSQPYETSPAQYPNYTSPDDDGQAKLYYDPVRDV